MSLGMYEFHHNEPGVVKHLVRIEGAGTNDPTATITSGARTGNGITVTRNAAVGKLRVTWRDSPGYFAGASPPAFQATTPSDLAGYSIVCGDFNVAGKYIDVWVYDATPTLDDLEAGWKLTLEFTFKQTGV